jgi:biotin operon repressor
MTHPVSPDARWTPAYEGPATSIRAIAEFLGMSTDDVRQAVSTLKDDGELIERRSVATLSPGPTTAPAAAAEREPGPRPPRYVARASRCDQCGRDLPSPRCRCKPR